MQPYQLRCDRPPLSDILGPPGYFPVTSVSYLPQPRTAAPPSAVGSPMRTAMHCRALLPIIS